MSFHEARAGTVRKNMKKSRTSDKWCSKCGLRVRGPNHDKGSHHNGKRS